jgi:hypothetical protein
MAAQLLRGDVIVTQKCIFHEPMPLDCGAGTTVDIVSAFWRRQEQGTCVKPEHVPKGEGARCHANAIEQVIKQCQGQPKCTLPSGFTGCPENPFTFIRVRFKCKPLHTAETVEEPFNSDNLKDLPIPADFSGKSMQITEGAPAAKMVSLVTPDRLSNDQCNLMHIGAWGPCQAKQKVDGQMSSPLLPGDNLCQCQFIAMEPMTCDRLFPSEDKVFTVTKVMYGQTVLKAVFGKEGCSCSQKETMKTMCDFAVRAEEV